MKDFDLPIGMMGQPPEVILRYRKMLASGESSRMAEMLACRQAPRADTDTAHFAGTKPMEDCPTLGPEYAKRVKAQAKAAGITIGPHSVYNGSLADARGGGDPGAWLLAGDGRAKLKRVARDRGMASETLGIKPGESQQRVEKFNKTKENFNRRKRERSAARAEIKALQKG